MKSIKNKRVWTCGCSFPKQNTEEGSTYIDPVCENKYYGKYCVINLEGVCIERRCLEHTDLCVQLKGHNGCEADSVFCDECGGNIFRLVRHPHTKGNGDRIGYYTPSLVEVEERLEDEEWEL